MVRTRQPAYLVHAIVDKLGQQGNDVSLDVLRTNLPAEGETPKDRM